MWNLGKAITIKSSLLCLSSEVITLTVINRVRVITFVEKVRGR